MTYAAILVMTVAAPPERGHELVYSGTCVETSHASGQMNQTEWSLRTRLFVLEAGEVATFTEVRDASGSLVSARLAVVRVTPNGACRAEPLTLAGPALVDPVAFVELPPDELTDGLSWAAAEPGRPPRKWRIVGAGVPPAGGPTCWRAEGEQGSPAGEAYPWRRRDAAWIDPRTGRARRLERTIELFDGAVRQTTTRYALEGELTYPGRLDAEIRADILAAWQAEQAAAGADVRVIDAAARRLAQHTRNQPVSAYREAVTAAARRLEAARRGAVQRLSAEAPTELVRGQPAPDFAAADLNGGAAVHLAARRGRPTALVIFRSDSPTVAESLGAVAGLNALAVFVGGDIDTARSLARVNAPDVPLLDGRSLPIFADVTPRFLVLDAAGVVREWIDGYGGEVPCLLQAAVKSAGGY